MKKYALLGIMTALVLGGCGNGAADQTTEMPMETTTAVEQSVETETTAAEETTEAEVKENEDVTEEKRTTYKPLNVEISAKYEGEWDDKGAIITADSATIHILDDGYEELKTAINNYNDRNWQEVYTLYLEHREYAKEETFPDDRKLYISRTIDVTRADEKVLSFVNAENSFMGGAHGSYYENAEVFDVESGKALELTDVVTDYDEVYEIVVDYLEENYEKDMFFDGYEEWLEEMFYEPSGAMASPVEWNLDMDGMTIRFNPYVIGPWVSGLFEVEIPYEGNEELFVEEYLPALAGGKIQKIAPDERIEIDTDRDGDAEVVSFTVGEVDESYHTPLEFTWHEELEMDGDSHTAKKKYYGSFAEAYLVEVPDELNEGESFWYLYVEYLMENDFRKLHVINLNQNEMSRHKIFDDLGDTEAAVYGHVIADSGQFALYSRIYTLGTYTGYKMYYVGADGMPRTEDEKYNLVAFGADWKTVLTAKRDLTVLIHDDGSEEMKEEKLPKGTVLWPRKTDGENIMEFELEDGRRCDLLIEKGEGDYQFYIDGVGEYDCFENLPYAG